ncbi:hypothetical protein [Jongsikchunia kroppenstedtii]|uniref:hypothetical protein n=1 Tax=Jongsikchunia kroppenstedtii TaxID=1121721 RepID=UPI00037D0155|nr:hypothetical protein [Jongsikchunia kroppenstedtii]
MTVERCIDSSPADWLVNQERDWRSLAGSGPLGYTRYARLRFIPDPEFPGQREGDVPSVDGPSESWQLAVAVSRLAGHTATPNDCYYLFWDGWPQSAYKRAGAATVDIRDERGYAVRGYYLFRGTTDMSSLMPLDRPTTRAALDAEWPIPAFIWPADGAWCVTNDVDPHFATIGGSSEAIADLLREKRIDVVPDDPAVDPPFYS